MPAVEQAIGDAALLVARVASATSSSTSDAAGLETSGAGEQDGDSEHKDNSNSPLLFFVALGFGVVFTNLWCVLRCGTHSVATRPRAIAWDHRAII